MNKLEYQPGIKGKAIQMDGPVAFVGTAENLRGREWSYELGFRGLTSATRAAREVDVDFFTDYATADALRRVADADVMGRTPGILVAQNEWKQRAYILSSSPNSIHFGRLYATLNVALLDGAWWRLVSKSFVQQESTTAYEYLDYPFDYPHDYAETPITPDVESSVLTPSDVRIVVYGPAVNPYVIVGGNTYQVNVTVPSGGYLTIDGRDKTIVLTLADGTTRNEFAAGVRGSGLGGGSYIFEPLQPGIQDVTWDGSFGLDFGWYEEEGEPPWSQS